MNIKFIWLVSITLLLAACGGDDVATSNNGTPVDVAVDTPVDTPVDIPVTASACEPLLV